MRSKIIVKKPEELIWPFEGHPRYNYNYEFHKYTRSIIVDPFPCTMHDPKLLAEEVEIIEDKFPIGSFLRWIILPHEVESRVNAWAQKDFIYTDDSEEQEALKKRHKLDCAIVFSGKRSNIHPAMTKFLVAHEYGHIVDHWITACMKEELDSRDDRLFEKTWCEFRSVKWKDDNDYGGGRYRNSITEMIADEFRIVIGRVDIDIWQHDSIEHPLTNGGIECKNFWNGMKEKYAFKP